MAEGARTEGMSPWRRPADVLLRRRWRAILSSLAVAMVFFFVYRLSGSRVFMVMAGLGVGAFALRLTFALFAGRFTGAALSPEAMERIERMHVIGAGLTAGLAGLGAALAMLIPLDNVPVLVCLLAVVGLMLQLGVRGYAAPGGVVRPLFLLVLPPLLASIARGEWLFIGVSLLLLVLAFEIRSATRGIRGELARRFAENRRLAALVEQFDTALDTMPHGLLLLDAARRVRIANRMARDLFDMPGPAGLQGFAIGATVPAPPPRGMADGRHFCGRLCEFAAGDLRPVLVALPGDVHMELSGARRDDGSAVIVFEDVSARVRAEARLLHLARFDALTGLPNRHFFAEQVRQTLQRLPEDAAVAFLLIDIDDLKAVNDLRGHAFGDRVMGEVGKRFLSLADQHTLVARMISDQFGVFFYDGEDIPDGLKSRILKFHAGLQGSYSAYDVALTLSFSGGYLITENRAGDTESWQMKADLALSEVKDRTRGLCVGYQRELDDRYNATRRLREDLRAALASGGLTAMFQPMYLPDGKEITCFEALARWTHPERGPIGPDVFIRMAEEMGVVSHITRFILEKACRECMRWPESIAVSVNLSAHDLKSRRIVDLVSETLAATGLDARRLHLEVTESSLMEDPLAAGVLLADLRATGVTIAIDDFGTGFSSISYLDTLPLDAVKIDRSFVRNVTDDPRRLKLLKGTVRLARELGLGVVVEGVETPEQLEVLIAHDCADLVQGYVFSRPLSGEDALGLIRRVLD